jgi:hypothetical protein
MLKEGVMFKKLVIFVLTSILVLAQAIVYADTQSKMFYVSPNSGTTASASAKGDDASGLTNSTTSNPVNSDTANKTKNEEEAAAALAVIGIGAGVVAYGVSEHDRATKPSPSAAKPKAIYAGTTMGVYKSINQGGSWAAKNNGLPANPYVDALAAMDGVIYAGLWSGNGVYESTDQGGNWSPINDGFPSSYPYIDSLLATDGVIYAGTASNGIWKRDASGTWNQDGLDDKSVLSLLATDGVIYAGTAYNGVYKRDASGTWSAVNNGLPTPYPPPVLTLLAAP